MVIKGNKKKIKANSEKWIKHTLFPAILKYKWKNYIFKNTISCFNICIQNDHHNQAN